MLLHEELSSQIIGAAVEVHRALGPGFLESTYEEALCHELRLRNLPFERQVPVPVHYKGTAVATHKLDLIIDKKVIVELKAITEFAEIHKAIAIAYLTATKLHLALLLNFGQSKVEMKRIVR